LGREPALVRLGLDRILRSPPDHPVQQCEGASHEDAQASENKDGEIALQHCSFRLYHQLCINLLHSDFPHQQAKSDPFERLCA
jgi:hypothetical protein